VEILEIRDEGSKNQVIENMQVKLTQVRTGGGGTKRCFCEG
jgi:hypothetical protein